MTALQKKVLIAGIAIKLKRRENLEDILDTYVKLTEDDKQEIRDNFITQEG